MCISKVIPPFYKGQEVVCIKTLEGYVTKGNNYIIVDCFYKCCFWLVTVKGVHWKGNDSTLSVCGIHGSDLGTVNNGDLVPIGYKYFAPIIKDISHLTIINERELSESF